ncbi:hypothetical protein A3735_06080 [Oleiphilus sp. HI0061]|uniref:hypothetical protein n=1 Tax=Oleiphilus sp. HI0061 TaxID=1822239 RepID=UPI0007CF51A6|nr:hypothetical protein [Oleiphilus sp. HI0061]KZY52456.1 hypothetical protein A3735_06080 [Oleiphilus sp. HI0061]
MTREIYPGKQLAKSIREDGIYGVFPEFETFNDSKRKKKKVIKALRSSKSPRKIRLARKLKNCRKNKRCGSGACPICYQKFRKRMIWATAKVIPNLHAVMFGTLVFFDDAIQKNELRSFSLKDMKRLINRIQQQLRRLKIQTPLIGSFEFAYSPDDQIWIPHLHFIALTNRGKDLKPLRPYLLKNSRNQTFAENPKPLKLKHITKKYAYTIGYCYKSSWERKISDRYGDKSLSGKLLTDSLLAFDKLGMRKKLFLFKFKSVETKAGLKLMKL